MHGLLVVLALFAAPVTDARPAAPSPASGVMVRGEKLKGLPPVELSSVLARPAEFDGKTVAIEAKIRRACQKKGCWMELATSEEGPGVRVTFKDYGFFVPLDSAGTIARVEGTVKVAKLSAAHAKHLEAEGARIDRSPLGETNEVRLIASGVELRK